MDKLRQVLGGAAIAIGGPVVKAYGIMFLWNWFIAPLGAPEINPAWAIGVQLAVTALWMGLSATKTGSLDKDYGARAVIWNCAAVWVCAGWGAIARLFM